MYRATTPEFNLIIPYNVQEVEKFVITLQQKGKTIIEYTNESREVTFEDRLIYFQLSQWDTKVFVTRYPIHLQIRLLLSSGRVVASNIVHIDVHNSLNLDGLYSEENI